MLEIETLDNQVIFSGSKEKAVEFLNNKGFRNIFIDTPIMLFTVMTGSKYNFYLR